MLEPNRPVAYHGGMKKKGNITEAEWPIMRVLWEKGSATAAEIVAEVTSERDVSMRTVKTLIRRLIAKKAVGYAIDLDDSRIYHYRALVDKADAVREKNASFLSVIYQDKVSDLLAHFVKDDGVTDEELREIQSLVEKKLKEKR